MRTGEKIMAYCHKPRSAQELAKHCKIQRSSVYSALGRLQVKGLIKRLDTDKDHVTYVMFKPGVFDVEENLIIKHAHNPFGLRL